jgi:hypothetical protein
MDETFTIRPHRRFFIPGSTRWDSSVSEVSINCSCPPTSSHGVSANLVLSDHTGVVDQHVDVQPEFIGALDDRGRRAGFGQIPGEHLTANAVLAM